MGGTSDVCDVTMDGAGRITERKGVGVEREGEWNRLGDSSRDCWGRRNFVGKFRSHAKGDYIAWDWF